MKKGCFIMTDTALLEIALPRDILALLGDKPQAGEAVREFILLGLYQEGRISGGKAAELLHLTKRGFIALLTRKGLDYFHLTPDEWQVEADIAKNWNTDPGNG
jgi:predicted HTH domain antitoxin